MTTKVDLEQQVRWTSDDITEWTVNLFLSTSDQTKLDNVPADLQTELDSKLEASDLSDYETTTQLNSRDTANRARVNHTWTQSADTITDWTTNKAYTATEKTKLAWIATGANVWVVPNSAITGATKTKITYDAKWLVTSWADATTADIADSLNKRYVTDANLTTIWNQSWTNSWDNATNTQYSWLATSKQDTLVSWTNIKTINSTSLLWSWDIVISWASPLTTKGDLFTYSTVDARLPLGTNWQVLTVDTSTATWLKYSTIAWWWDLLSTNNLSDLTNDATARVNLWLEIWVDVAPIASPTFTWTPSAPTAWAGDSTTQIATTEFVQSAVRSVPSKEACKYATTTALPTLIYNNGSSWVGATLTWVSVGALSVDGNTPSVGDRILVKNQVSTFQNGIYTVTVVGSVITVFVLTRALDFNEAQDIKTWAATFITNGATYTSTTWDVNSADSPIMGTDAITFIQSAWPWDETATSIWILIWWSDDATPNDTDFIATSLTAWWILKKLTWTNAKAFLKTYFDTLYISLIGDQSIAWIKKFIGSVWWTLTDLIVSTDSWSKYRQTFRADQTNGIFWHWWTEADEDAYMTVSNWWWQNRIKNNTRSFNIFRSSDASPDIIVDWTTWNTWIWWASSATNKLKVTWNIETTWEVITTDEAYDATAWNWSLEVPTKNAIRDKFESLWWGSNLTWTDLLTAWENMSAGQNYRKWVILNTISQETAWNNLNIWANTTTEYERWQSITWAWWSLQAIDVWMLKNWTPNHIWNIEIFSDAGFTTLVATSTNSKNASELWGSAEKVTFFFSWYNPWASTLYFKLNLVSWTVSASNFTYISVNLSSVYAWWQEYYINSWWSVTGQTYDLKFNVYWKYETLTSYFKADATLSTLNKIQWVIKTTVTAWNTFYGNLWWEQWWYTGLTEWEVYYLKDDWTIWTTAGTTSVKVGRAISTTKINFVPPL